MEKKYDHQQAQEQLKALWEAHKIYRFQQLKQPSSSLYSIDTPPPTVSGSLHIGHIFSYTQTDIIARYKRLSGYQVYYPFGFDDNGLPTERFIEKKRSISAYQLGRSAFIDICLQETREVEQKFKELWQNIGLSVDWSQEYSTISPLVRRISQESFIKLFEKGFAYRRNEPALYCTSCRTSVAQAELDDAIKTTQFSTITFQTVAGEKIYIATTRPELLGSCIAVMYNPHDPRYQHLKNTRIKVPLFDYEVSAIADELVQIDKGTGLVMLCTFGDKTDISWFKKYETTYQLPYKQSIGFDGKILFGPAQGLKVSAAREKILQLLAEQHLITEQKTIEHAVNIHERCKNEIEYLMLSQWFLSILPYKQELIELGERINWYPSFMKARFKNWVENLSWDWGLSRQRFFGIPFPAWHCSCGMIHMAEVKDLPIDPQETPLSIVCKQCGKSDAWRGDTDVMDTWNTSSLTPFICAALERGSADGLFDTKPDFLPMSMRPQAHDIIRTWAFYTMIKTWMHYGDIPWKDIVISGHVLSTQKEKISKSQGNSPLEPEQLLATYGTDALRFWTASGSLGHDVPFSDNQLKIGQKLITKLWNAFRFIHEHCADITLEAHEPTLAVNQWITLRASSTWQKYHQALQEHEFGSALTAVEQFFWHDFCDNYLELIKDYLFNPDRYTAQESKDIKQTLYITGLRILQLYAPYLVYITDSLYQELYKRSMQAPSLHVTRYQDIQAALSKAGYKNIEHTFELVLTLVSAVRKLKSDHQLSLKTELAQLTVVIAPEHQASLEAEIALLKGVTRAQEITMTTAAEVSENKSTLVLDAEKYYATVYV